MTDTTLQLQQRLHRETSKAFSAYIDYRDMGVSRSLRKLVESYTAPNAPQDCPTKNLTTIEGWSSKFKWQDRIAEWEQHQFDKREELLEQERHAERIKRGELLEKFRRKIEMNMWMATLQDDDSIKAFNALTRAMNTYMMLSMRHYNDLPTERKDLTSGDQPIAVNFITEPVPEDVVNERLELLNLSDYVDEQSA